MATIKYGFIPKWFRDHPFDEIDEVPVAFGSAPDPEPLVWWLCQKDCEAIGTELNSNPSTWIDWPEYLRTQYLARLGRPGRGRLWVDGQFGEVSVSWPDSPMGRLLAEGYGGIVIKADDARHVKDLPGYLTDLRMEKV